LKQFFNRVDFRYEHLMIVYNMTVSLWKRHWTICPKARIFHFQTVKMCVRQVWVTNGKSW